MNRILKICFLFLLCILIFDCKTQKNSNDIPKKNENNKEETSDENNYVNDAAVNEDEPSENAIGLLLADISYNDKYGNLFHQNNYRKKITCSLLYTPDIELLTQLKDNLVTLTINNKQLTDISFLKNLPQLKELIVSLEPIKYLNKLESLKISSRYKKTIDCSVFRNLENLKQMDLGDNDVENLGALDNLRVRYSDKIKGLKEYYEKYRSIDYSNSYVFHYDKYYILQYGVNVRAKPTRNSDIIAVLNLNDEIQIVENSEVEEEINGDWGYWYKIKHNDITGYTFGRNIAAKTLITDIDKNGIKDYFYLRFSSPWNIDPDKDILIYINNQRISTKVISTSKRYAPFQSCTFEERDGYVLIDLRYEGHDSLFIHIFRVLPNGKIEEDLE